MRIPLAVDVTRSNGRICEIADAVCSNRFGQLYPDVLSVLSLSSEKIGSQFWVELQQVAVSLIIRTLHADYETDGLVAPSVHRATWCRKADNLLWTDVDTRGPLRAHQNNALESGIRIGRPACLRKP